MLNTNKIFSTDPKEAPSSVRNIISTSDTQPHSSLLPICYQMPVSPLILNYISPYTNATALATAPASSTDKTSTVEPSWDILYLSITLRAKASCELLWWFDTGFSYVSVRRSKMKRCCVRVWHCYCKGKKSWRSLDKLWVQMWAYYWFYYWL